jgi:tRNA-guanine transglycosylase
MSALSFEILLQDSETAARVGLMKTRHGEIQTPYFVPVATFATVRALGSDDLENLGVQCALANTYHLHLKPGDDLIKRLGGLHRFMGFSGPLFSDSGGFQAFSLGFGREHNISKIGSIFPEETASRNRQRKDVDPEPVFEWCAKAGLNGSKKDRPGDLESSADEDGPRIDGSGAEKRKGGKKAGKQNLTRISDEGISFFSQADGAWHFLDAKSSMKIQSNLGSDIIMAFDECTSPLSDYDYTRKAMHRTHDWALQSLHHHDSRQAIYGIIQGGWFEDLRLESADFISSLPFDGIAIGGSLGNCKHDMHQVLEWVVPRLDDRPRHLLGIGEIDDIFECVQRGIDTFDCVSPTRIARRGSLLISPSAGGARTNKFRINIKNARFREDEQPVDPNCCCPTCRRYSRAYLRHLYVSSELSYFRLASMHNLHFMLRLMEEIRGSIKTGTFRDLKEMWLGEAAGIDGR